MTQIALVDDLCECGCGERAGYIVHSDKRTGVKKGEPRRYIRGHVARRGPVDYVVDEAGCWVWQRVLNKKGYGSKYDHKAGGCRMAHRVYYEREHGSLSDEVALHHLCGNPSCVNPAHLEPVTLREHNAMGERRAISVLAAEGVSLELLARAFGRTQGQIRRLIS